ncbi:MAG: tellurite resistance TerB family protein [Alphaproteobacteria bacterium]
MADEPVLDHHAALIHVMVLTAAADADMTDAEMQAIGEMVRMLPVFRDYDMDRLSTDASACADLLSESDGLDTALSLVAEALPNKLCETAYALACDVAAADGVVSQEESRLLEMIRYRLAVGRLPAAAIERGARARHARL